MRKRYLVSLCLVLAAVVFISFKDSSSSVYKDEYYAEANSFKQELTKLVYNINTYDLSSDSGRTQLRKAIGTARRKMKETDFWFRHLDPLAYKAINSPLPVEWETEVFEKYEKPYKRVGAGLTLAALYLDEAGIDKDTLRHLVQSSLSAIDIYLADSTTDALNTYHHFYLCNRLFLLNLAAIYTTGFECPEADSVIPELRVLLKSVDKINIAFSESFPHAKLSEEYLAIYQKMVQFVDRQPSDHKLFDHYTFIRSYVNPLFALNQRAILNCKVVSRSMLDYSLSKSASSIFDKSLYNGQDAKGIFIRVADSAALAAIEALGKKLFYDPILSGNNMRTCASCHKPKQFFTDTAVATAFHFDKKQRLLRNTPTLVNAVYNHLLMLDGRHFTLQHQGLDVITNPTEMGSSKEQLVEKVMSCREYKRGFQKLLEYTPQEKVVSYSHVVSAITYYYGKFSKYYAPFDNAMNGTATLSSDAIAGFNLFMSKAQCGTCHFVPQFNGVKPPYVGSEFEVLGVPSDTLFKTISPDEGRYAFFAVDEMKNAFRTGTVRNAARTKPYMHNGVFTSLEEVIDFYDAGGGAGRGLTVANQTLSTDSLKLTVLEKKQLIAFIHSLSENVIFEEPPESLPASKLKSLNKRVVGGVY